ncbi:MAG: ACT domain-containing protein [Clostridia bacterium]|nr:ACT domain-containing protein [Clostridia bacterium]
MRAVITVVGKDAVGILAKVSGCCSDHHINVIEVTQSILQEMFAMIMMVDIANSDIPFTRLVDEMTELGKQNHLVIHCMHEEIFSAMHTI